MKKNKENIELLKQSRKLADKDIIELVGISQSTLSSWKRLWKDGKRDWRFNVYLLLKNMTRQDIENFKNSTSSIGWFDPLLEK